MNDMYFSHSDSWYEPEELPEPEVYCPHCGTEGPGVIFRIDEEIRCEECVDVITDWAHICRILKEAEL